MPKNKFPSTAKDSVFHLSYAILLLFFATTTTVISCSAQQQTSSPEPDLKTASFVSFSQDEGYFPLSSDSKPVPLYISEEDDEGVIRAMGDLQKDIQRVTDTEPELSTGSVPQTDRIVLAGTIGNNPVIDQLSEEGKIDLSGIYQKRETFLIQTVTEPLPGIDEALVIAGSDKRGTIYGIYEVSRQIGVSPWYWWADVPVPHQPDLYVAPGAHTLGEPAVEYRGIFINNENPSLLGWVEKTYGGFNHNFYENVFELILRQRGNYLWPAMWGKALYDDDPMNAEMADMYGIVIGFTHHEPMMRSHVEWDRYGDGPWNYDTNPETLREFWTEGIERMKTNESSVTLGMRGDGDEPMSDEANIDLLERIVRDQREILEEHSQQDSEVKLAGNEYHSLAAQNLP